MSEKSLWRSTILLNHHYMNLKLLLRVFFFFFSCYFLLVQCWCVDTIPTWWAFCCGHSSPASIQHFLTSQYLINNLNVGDHLWFCNASVCKNSCFSVSAPLLFHGRPELMCFFLFVVELRLGVKHFQSICELRPSESERLESDFDKDLCCKKLQRTTKIETRDSGTRKGKQIQTRYKTRVLWGICVILEMTHSLLCFWVCCSWSDFLFFPFWITIRALLFVMSQQSLFVFCCTKIPQNIVLIFDKNKASHYCGEPHTPRMCISLSYKKENKNYGREHGKWCVRKIQNKLSLEPRPRKAGNLKSWKIKMSG